VADYHHTPQWADSTNSKTAGLGQQATTIQEKKLIMEKISLFLQVQINGNSFSCFQFFFFSSKEITHILFPNDRK